MGLEEEIAKIITALSASATAILILLAVATIPYFMSCYALYKIADKCNASFKLLSWIPVVRYYTVAQIADFYRMSRGKDAKMATQMGAALGLLVLSLVVAAKGAEFMIIPAIICIPFFLLVKLFSLYYFYKFCDPENATIFFILGSNALLGNFFIYHCRNVRVSFRMV